MKFAKELLNSALPEWRVFFISYKRLKRILKSLIEQGKEVASDDLFWTALGEELSRVKRFYEAKHVWAFETITRLEEIIDHLEFSATSQWIKKSKDNGNGNKEKEEEEAEEEDIEGKDIDLPSTSYPLPIVERIASLSNSADRPPRPPPPPSSSSSHSLSSPSVLGSSLLKLPLPTSHISLQSNTSPLIHESSTTSALVSSSWSDFSPADRSRTASSFDSDSELPSLLASPDRDRQAGASPPSLFSASSATTTPILTAFSSLRQSHFPAITPILRSGISKQQLSVEKMNQKSGGGMKLLRTVSKESQSSIVSNLLQRDGSPLSSTVSDDGHLTPNFLSSTSMHRDSRDDDEGQDDYDPQEHDEQDDEIDRDLETNLKDVQESVDNDIEDVNDTNDTGSVVTTTSVLLQSSTNVDEASINSSKTPMMTEKGIKTRYKHFFSFQQGHVESHKSSLPALLESDLSQCSTVYIINKNNAQGNESHEYSEINKIKNQDILPSSSSSSSSSSSFNQNQELETSVIDESEPILPQVEFAAVRKRVHDLEAELSLLVEYCRLNDTAVYKIVKKHDKLFHSSTLVSYRSKLYEDDSPFSFLTGKTVSLLVGRAASLAKRVRQLEPEHAAWSRIKVVTIGTFDVAHHGHVNLLRSMRAFGKCTIVGIHDDVSYALLKGKPPEEPLETRMAAIRDFCDLIFVIPSIDPTPYLAASLLPSDVDKKRVVYVRGEDMVEFPGRKWIESKNIPIYLLPRTEAVSSTLIKAVSAVAKNSSEGSTSPTSILIRDRQLDVALGKLSFTT